MHQHSWLVRLITRHAITSLHPWFGLGQHSLENRHASTKAAPSMATVRHALLGHKDGSSRRWAVDKGLRDEVRHVVGLVDRRPSHLTHLGGAGIIKGLRFPSSPFIVGCVAMAVVSPSGTAPPSDEFLNSHWQQELRVEYGGTSDVFWLGEIYRNDLFFLCSSLWYPVSYGSRTTT
jgi:hypothetical protein